MEKDNKGRLFTEKERSVSRQGTINVNGNDEYFIITKREREGKNVLELFHKVGFVNPNTNPKNEKSPKYFCDFTYNTFPHTMSLWLNQSEGGTKTLSVSVKFKEEKKDKPDWQEKIASSDDDI